MDELSKDPIGLQTLDQVELNPTVATIESAVFSSYQPLSTTLNAIVPDWRWDLGTVFRNDIVLHDIAAHDMNKKWAPDGDQPWMDEVSDFSFTSQNQAFNGIWVYDYEGINRVNLAVSYLTDVEVLKAAGINEDRADQLLGEAYFLRAYYYFDLINHFGDVPLILEPSTSFTDAFDVSVRVSEVEVQDQIASDLSAAKTLLSDSKYNGEFWRVSKGAVIALEVKQALFNEDWAEVLSLIAELDALGHYSLNANYFSSFDAALEGAENEVIFAYDHRSDEIPANANGLRDVSGWGFFAPTDDFINAFESDDPRLAYTVEVDTKRSAKIIGSATESIDYGNRVYIRYADVLLWKAEALIQTSQLSDAVSIINDIRERARTSPTLDGAVVPVGTLADRPTSNDKNEVMEWLMAERRVELGFESQRFNDLKRWGVAETVLGNVGVNFQSFHNLYPIPQVDIDKSGGSIVQNPKY